MDIASWLGERDEAIWCFQEFPSKGDEVLQDAGFSFESSNRIGGLVGWSWPPLPAVTQSFILKGGCFQNRQAGQYAGGCPGACGHHSGFSVHLQSLQMGIDYKAVDEGPNQREGFRLLGLVSSASAARAQQAQELKKRMDDSPYPVIVAGDFNDVPMSYAMSVLRSNGTHDTFEASDFGFKGTHIGSVPGLRIDAILVDESMLTLKHETHDVELSDHRPVTATLGLKR